MQNTPDVYLTPQEVAERYRIHPGTVRRWITEGRIRAVRVGGRWRVSESAAAAMAQPNPGIAGREEEQNQ